MFTCSFISLLDYYYNMFYRSIFITYFAYFADRTVMLWYAKDFTSKDRKSLRVNIEFDHATLIRWSPDGKAFIIHKAVANAIEVYKIAKKPDGHLASATKALEFPQVLQSCLCIIC